MNNQVIECQHIVKKYGSKFALNDFTVSIPAGKVTGILGPNGAGKSTFFRMVMGLVRPEQGHMQVLGSRPGWQTNKDIAYLPDRARWYADHTVEKAMQWAENLLPGFNRERAEKLADFMDLDRSMKVAGMSLGQEARLMLLICIARDVPMILLDEPFSGIDIVSRERIIGTLIDNISETEQTILLSTHEIDEAESLFDHVVFMENGQVRLTGEAETLRAEHGSMETLYRKLYR
ncbi:ABC transporter ATP-binding protein [Brevibacillus massiliensis]|uniref:ABC transporter ATP-binding protein n=1 Tax=Brevibacillus massiliensis TaxID=1118054 RepID=UPI0002D8614A|nr:ABC transporter ATP-binding protein [Brevibacillus massiliensis]